MKILALSKLPSGTTIEALKLMQSIATTLHQQIAFHVRSQTNYSILTGVGLQA